MTFQKSIFVNVFLALACSYRSQSTPGSKISRLPTFTWKHQPGDFYWRNFFLAWFIFCPLRIGRSKQVDCINSNATLETFMQSHLLRRARCLPVAFNQPALRSFTTVEGIFPRYTRSFIRTLCNSDLFTKRSNRLTISPHFNHMYSCHSYENVLHPKKKRFL